MHHVPSWIGGLTGMLAVGGVLLARGPVPPARQTPVVAQVATPSAVVPHGRPLFAPTCSAVYRMDGCEMARRATWKA